MSNANNSLRVSSLNFKDIKSNLTDYLKSKSEFADFDFTGSTLNTLLDVMAYNTYYNAFYLNMVANEMYVDSAIKRENVASLAKALNYFPRTARSAVAELSLLFVPTDAPDQIVIPKFTRFKTKIDGVEYEFVTAQDYVVLNDGGLYTKVINVYEGVYFTYKYIYDADQKPYFSIPLDEIDSTSVEVTVRSNDLSTDSTTYTLVSDITEVTSDSTVYYIQESLNGKYEVYFGDGVLGKALEDGNVVSITVRTCNGSAANSASSFDTIGYSGYNSSNSTSRYVASIQSVLTPAEEGQSKETIDAIKFNAPRSYETQNRLVTETDYTQFLLNNFSDIQSISVWGGEENDPPYYGKVILSVKPENGFLISENRKKDIITRMKKYNPMSIDVLITDPSFVYVKPTTTVSYNSTKTTLTADALMNKVAMKIQAYEDDNLSIFGNEFRYSKFIKALDDSDNSIVGNETEILFQKRFVPTLNSRLTYKIEFYAAIKNPFSGYQGAVSSTGFTLEGISQTLYIDDDGKGNIRTYYLDDTLAKVYVNTSAGTVNYETGVIFLDSFIFRSYEGDEVQIDVEPESKDLTPVRNQIILLTTPEVSLFDIGTKVITKVSTVDVEGNESPVKTDSVLNTVVV